MSETEPQKRPLRIPAAIAALMLFGALASWPYGYYQLLRWATCAAAVFVAYMAYEWQKIWATVLFGVVAILFNPLLPIHLTREIWQPIDVICALLFVIVAMLLQKPAEEKK